VASGKIKEKTLGTTQGNCGMKGETLFDHSNGGCTVISLLLVSACLVRIASSFLFEKIIDIFCQKPLERIRHKFYNGKGFVHVTAEQASDELFDIGLLDRPDVSSHVSYLRRRKKPIEFPPISQVNWVALNATGSQEIFLETWLL